MRRTILVTGSTAIDQTGVYGGNFAEYQAKYPIKALNMSFQLQDIQTSFGGCAPNIAWGLNQLGIDVIPLSSAGRSFRDRYQNHLQSNGINTDFIAIDDSIESCASCLMINDLHGNQIISFYPGPGSSLRKLPSEIDLIDQVGLAILGPEAPDLTLAQARDLSQLCIPMLFDPGQVITDFDRAALVELLTLSRTLIVNDYEYNVLLTNADMTPAEVVACVDELVVTHGESGVDIHTGGSLHHVSAIPDVEIVDVTGCGDAFRAGYACGMLHELEPVECGQLGCIVAMQNLTSPQTQNYRTNLDQARSLQRKYYH